MEESNDFLTTITDGRLQKREFQRRLKAIAQVPTGLSGEIPVARNLTC